MDDRHEQYCPNCSGVSPTSGYCASCLAMLIAAERGDNLSWLQEDSFTAFGRDDNDGDEAFGGDGDEAFGGDGDEAFGGDSDGGGEPEIRDYEPSRDDGLRNLGAPLPHPGLPVDDRREQYCPNCSGVSPTGGYCASCLAMLIAAERGDNSSWLQEDSFTAFGRDDDDGDEAFSGDGDGGGEPEIRDYEPSRDDGLRNLGAPLPQLGLSGEPRPRDPVPDATFRPDADVPGRPPADPSPTLPLSTPGALTDPVLQGLLPPDRDAATRLLSDLTLMGDRIDAAAALRANGNVAQAQAAERAAREVYDFWSAFYRSQERLALIAERLHELTVASIKSAEADWVAGQQAAQMLDGVVELSPKTYSEMTGAAEEPHPYRQGYLNGVFMEEALAKIKDEAHPLHDLLYDSKRENWTSRADDTDEPTVQAGHLVSRHAGLREYFALEDSSLNQLSGQQGETQGAIFVKTAIGIGGIPVERRTAELWEKQGKLDAGTVENAQPHPGWTRIRKPRKTRKATA